LPENAVFTQPTLFIREVIPNHILDTDFSIIEHHFPMATIETIPKVGHWLHAENPTMFYDKVISFLE
jgi:pimeloyl-ACP methyl ester carboxylesterase